jgi:hypothetical protein
VQRPKLIRNQTEFFFQLPPCHINRVFAHLAGTAREVENPPTDGVTELAGEKNRVAVDDQGRDGKRDALIHFIVRLCSIAEQHRVIDQRRPTSPLR